MTSDLPQRLARLQRLRPHVFSARALGDHAVFFGSDAVMSEYASVADLDCPLDEPPQEPEFKHFRLTEKDGQTVVAGLTAEAVAMLADFDLPNPFPVSDVLTLLNRLAEDTDA